MKAKFVLIPVLILITGLIIMLVLSGFRKDPPQMSQQEKARIVDAAIVQLSDVQSEISGFGRIMTAQPLVLFSEVNGTMVSGSVPFQPAQSFRKGDLLIKIDDRQIRLDIQSTKSDLLNALAGVLPEIKVDFPDEFKIWQNYFNHCDYDSKLEPLPETDNQKIKLFLSRFNVHKLYFMIRNLEIQLEKHFFYAPFNGSIISADLRIGSTARVGTRLGEIINLDDMEIQVPVPAQDIEWIDSRLPVSFSSSELAGTWSGNVQRLGKNIDSRTQTVSVFMDIRNSDRGHLFNGLFLKASIPGKVITGAMSLPRKLVYNDTYLYMVKNGRLRYQKVNIARRELDRVIVNGGIANGDTLVAEVMQGVADGMPAVTQINTEN